jgi:hypothetical protein
MLLNVELDLDATTVASEQGVQSGLGVSGILIISHAGDMGAHSGQD